VVTRHRHGYGGVLTKAAVYRRPVYTSELVAAAQHMRAAEAGPVA
jgi:hypothetical protein